MLSAVAFSWCFWKVMIKLHLRHKADLPWWDDFIPKSTACSSFSVHSHSLTASFTDFLSNAPDCRFSVTTAPWINQAVCSQLLVTGTNFFSRCYSAALDQCKSLEGIASSQECDFIKSFKAEAFSSSTETKQSCLLGFFFHEKIREYVILRITNMTKIRILKYDTNMF